MKRYQEQHKGQSLIEILLAMGLAVIAISAVAYALVGPQAAVRQSADRMRAEALATEGLEAVRAMAIVSFDDLVPGTHGLQYADDHWEFDGASDAHDDFERSVTLTEVSEGLYEVTSVVTWEISSVREADVSLTTYVSNWRQTAGDAAHVAVAVDSLEYTASGTRIVGAEIANTHATQTVTVTDLLLAWEGDAELESIWIDGEEVFTTSSSSPIESDTTIDIDDAALTAGAPAVAFGPFIFNADVQDTPVHITSFLSDGSKRYTHLVP